MKKDFLDYTALDIFKHAEHFMVSGKYLSGCMDSEFNKFHFILPIGALSAFSSELFLKCLIMVEHGTIPNYLTKGKDGHNLEKLFYALSQSNQDKVSEYYHEIAAYQKNRKSPETKAILQRLNRWEIDFPKELKESSEAFINFRYGYSVLSNYTAPYLKDATRQRILDLNPNWVNLIDDPDKRIDYNF